MASEYRLYSDFPHRALPLWSWPDLSRRMLSASASTLEINSIIIDEVGILSDITSEYVTESGVTGVLTLNSRIL